MMNESTRKRLWKEMGVELWYLRPEISSQIDALEKSSEVPADLDSGKQTAKTFSIIEERKNEDGESVHDPFRFQYLSSDKAVWLFADELNSQNRRILQDAVLTFNLLNGFVDANKMNEKEKIGVFEWPLIFSSVDPAKALTTFFEKYHSEGKKVFVCQNVCGTVGSFFEKGNHYREIPNLNDLIINESAKKSLWEILRSTRD